MKDSREAPTERHGASATKALHLAGLLIDHPAGMAWAEVFADVLRGYSDPLGLNLNCEPHEFRQLVAAVAATTRQIRGGRR